MLITLSRMVSCPDNGGRDCAVFVTLRAGEDGVTRGTGYIVKAMVANRYGESTFSGNSEPFTVGSDSGKTEMCVVVRVRYVQW